MKKKMFCRNGQFFAKNLAKNSISGIQILNISKASKVHSKIPKNPIKNCIENLYICTVSVEKIIAISPLRIYLVAL